MGAAAYCPQTSETKHLYLGTDKQFNVYAAELSAIDLAIDIADTTTATFKKCKIHVDSQAAIKATMKPGKQLRQGILCTTVKKIERLAVEKGITTEIV